MGTSGCVSFMFDTKGLIVIDKEEIDMDDDELMMIALDAGAEDFAVEEDSYEITTMPDDIGAVREALEAAGIPMVSAEVTMIEEIILNYLRESGFPCYLSVPEEPSGNFVVLDKTGSGYDEGLFHATLAVQSYGKSKFSAAQLSHHVVQAMLDADTLPEVVSCELVTDYDFPDTTRKLPRYQAVFELVHY